MRSFEVQAGRRPSPDENGAREGSGNSAPKLANPLPSLSLPKGGGALRGIGERFSVNPATGAGSTSVPIPVPAGRPGFELSLALSYDTSAGNGPFGAGWGLSPPSVSRKTDQGLPRYFDAEESDHFLLSGSDELVFVGLAPEAPAGHERESYDIARYRPRVDRAFDRIERWTHRTSREVHWRVTDRNNVTQVFGATAEARIADPNDARRVFRWLLEETRDDRGNVARYEYQAEDLSEVDVTRPSERHRAAPGQTPSAQRYLKRVHFGNRTPFVSADWMFSVVFDYGDHDPDRPAVGADRAWPVRSDPFSDYRAGFEVRTYRLCRRVLVFHDFPAERADPTAPWRGPELVRSMRFEYDGDAFEPGREPSRILRKLRRITLAGHRRRGDGSYEPPLELPPLEFEYSPAELRDELGVVPRESLEGIPAGAPGAGAQWVDLDSEGIPGTLSQEQGVWFFKSNLGEGRLAPPEPLRSLPAGGAGTQQLLDLGGDGRVDWVAYGPPLPGYFARRHDGEFEPFVALDRLPNLDFDDPNLRFVDLDGDGHADVLVSEDDVFVWYRSREKRGFDACERVFKGADEEHGPRIVFTDPTESVQLADMSGDGLLDLVRIRNGEVCYWPNLGYGRFGRKVTMDGAPRFAESDQFDPARLRLGDIDGSGTTDIVYLGAGGPRVFLNESGNGFSEGQLLASFPPVDSLANVALVDLFGRGTACLVWASPLPSRSAEPLVYIDLMDEQKPHLMVAQRNNLGRETRLLYAPSTRFYLEDKLAGRPWLTRLPFPVHVVERVEHFDAVRNARIVSEYRYRHGFFDAEEREFRGFGYVEQRDAESFSGARGRGLFELDLDNEAEEFRQPPALTKSWFHTGAWLERETLEAGFAREYCDGELLLPDTGLPRRDDGRRYGVRDERELVRALAGTPLRQEVFAEDGTALAALPYLVKEQNQGLRLLRPAEGERHAVVMVLPGETIEAYYERRSGDPRVTHSFTLEVDDFGNVRRAAQVAYPRRSPARDNPENPAAAEQARSWALVTETELIHRPDELDWCRHGLPQETRIWELSLPLFESDALLRPSDVDGAFFGSAEKRLLDQSQTLYAQDDQSGALPLGEIESLALPFESYKLAFNAELVGDLFGDRFSPDERRSLLGERGGYVERFGAWWLPSGRVELLGDRFFVPHRFTDPFGSISSVEYDAAALFPVLARDALHNTTRITPDYHALQPALLTDPNDNQSAVAFDALARVVAVALMGKPEASEGDTLAEPTARFDYHLDEWRLRARPVFVRAEARETHRDPLARRQVKYTYSDGSGNAVMEKVQAEPGPAYLVRDGEVVFDPAIAERWVGTGRVVIDNKGNPVKQYEPYFSRTFDYESEAALVEFGVTPVLHYDPLGRVIETELPDGSLNRVEFDAWTQTSFDGNDLVIGSAWEETLEAAPPPPDLPPLARDPNRHALGIARRLSGSPGRVHLDALGRPSVTVADNRERDAAGSPIEPADPESSRALLISRAELDIEGNALRLRDARGVQYAEQFYDLLGRRYRIDSVDAGTTTTLLDIAGQPILELTPNGHILEQSYDCLRRPSELGVRRGTGRVRLKRSVYGESHPAANARNLRGQLFRCYDGAGLVTHARYDFKGNLLEKTRALVTAHRPFDPELQQAADWTDLPAIERSGSDDGSTPRERDPLAVDSLPDRGSALEARTLTEVIDYDALNRPILETLHDGSVIHPSYNESGFLESLSIAVAGEAAPMSVIRNIDYNARGQRTLVEYSETRSGGAGSFATELTYDPFTFRLTQLLTTRSDGVTLQDLRYSYDAVGNIVAILDASEHGAVDGHNLVSPHRYFDYDASYQLIRAEGREFPRGIPGFDPSLDDAQGLKRYTVHYRYDRANNLAERAHRIEVRPGFVQGWTQSFEVEAGQLAGRSDVFSNRLVATEVTGLGAGDGTLARDVYRYDAAGNLLNLPHIDRLSWTAGNQLGAIERTGTLSGFYAYDAGGERVRKVVETGAGIVREHIYFNYFEVFREWRGGELSEERETLKVTDGERCVLLVERETVRGETSIVPPEVRLRFQLGDHLESVGFEVDERGSVITYEEFLPYGETAVFVEHVDVPRKRYRYTGKERDEESGLSYHSARYYAPWLGRWCSADPAEFVDGANILAYGRSNPATYHDPVGLQHQPRVDLETAQETVQRARRSRHSGPPLLFKHLAHSDALRFARLHASVDFLGRALSGEEPYHPTAQDRVDFVVQGLAEPYEDSQGVGRWRSLVMELPEFQEASRQPGFNVLFARYFRMETVRLRAAAIEGELNQVGDLITQLLMQVRGPAPRLLGPGTPARAWRDRPGMAFGASGLRDITGQWLRGNVRGRGIHGRIPGQIARRLEGRRFSNFRSFREAFWREVAADQHLAAQFDERQLTSMRAGRAPHVDVRSQLGNNANLRTYNIDHIRPIEAGGSVYDMRNMRILAPRTHRYVTYGR
jgi:RHS repeat-associated protein